MTATLDPAHLRLMSDLSARTRSRRAAVRREIGGLPGRESRRRAAEVLADPEPACAGMSAYHLLVSCKHVGPRNATTMLVRAGVPQHKRLMDMTDRQRDALTALLRAG